MVNAERPSDFFHDPHSVMNRAAGLLILAFFAPVILIIAATLMARAEKARVFVAARQVPGGAARLWQFHIAAPETPLEGFLQRSRLNLLPQLVNVARGDIDISQALR
jgi:lipopolysaccharide/colanic/teichoic acid biosynthesis glycosyltransferase